ncbi:MAG: hypothetical protein MJ239_02770 [Bacilli bacterium]|nr:hypothetical protein [Bacilli bacterium]
MNKNKVIFILSSAMLLASCGQGGTSSSLPSSFPSLPSSDTSEATSTPSETSTPLSEDPSSSTSSSSAPEVFPNPAGGKADFVQVCGYVRECAMYEAYGSTTAHIINKTEANTISDTLDETYTMFANGMGCESVGTVVEKVGDRIEVQDNIVRRKIVKDEQFSMDDGTVGTFPMFIDVTDYEDDAMIKYAYQDKAEMLFVVDSDEEAEEAGLSPDQYVTSTNTPLLVTANVTSAMYYYVGYTLYENMYLLQVGATTFDYAPNATTGGFDFTYEGSYQINGDLGDVITYTYTASFSTSEDGFLISAEYSMKEVDASIANPEDSYTSINSFSAELEYGLREDDGSEAVDPDSYFLSTVEAVEFFQPTHSEIGIDSEVVFNGGFLFLNGRATSYTPAKAMDRVLVPTATSDPSVAKISKGGDAGSIIEVVGFGEVTITFSYSGRVDGVFVARTFEKKLNVIKPAPTSIVLPSYYDTTLTEGNSYELSITVLPSTADNAIKVSTDVDGIISATVSSDNKKVTVQALKAGTVTLTIASAVDPTVYKTITYTVNGASTDYSKILCSHVWHSETKRVYGYLLDLEFFEDGTAAQTYTVVENGQKFVGTYKWTIKDNKFTFTNPSSGAFPVIYDGLYDSNTNELTINAQGDATIYYTAVEK